MKKFIVLFLFFTNLCLSQNIVDDVSIISYINLKTDYHVTNKYVNTRVYIENNFLILKSDSQENKYKIINKILNKKNEFVYEIIFDNKTHYATAFKYSNSERITKKDKTKNECFIIYKRKKATN